MTATTCQTIAELVAAQGITATSHPVPLNPNMEDSEWAANHYKVTLRRGRRQLTAYYSMGTGHTEPPTVEGVLDCLASDASSIDNARGFLDWAGELGYDTDSRKAERTYRICKRQAAKLLAFLDPAIYEVLLYHTERA